MDDFNSTQFEESGTIIITVGLKRFRCTVHRLTASQFFGEAFRGDERITWTEIHPTASAAWADVIGQLHGLAGKLS